MASLFRALYVYPPINPFQCSLSESSIGQMDSQRYASTSVVQANYTIHSSQRLYIVEVAEGGGTGKSKLARYAYNWSAAS